MRSLRLRMRVEPCAVGNTLVGIRGEPRPATRLGPAARLHDGATIRTGGSDHDPASSRRGSCRRRCGGLSAQAPAPTKSQARLEVATVKPNNCSDTRSMIAWPKGSFSATSMQLRMLIEQAYDIPPGLQRFTVMGGPEELLTARFDIQARLPETHPKGNAY